MPAYDFECSHCGHKFTVRTPMSERKKVRCPHCESTELRQLITNFMCSSKSGSAGSGGCASGRQGGFS
ncbi:MAG: FmdB family zinc ribbon protein [Bacillota bacterium]